MISSYVFSVTVSFFLLFISVCTIAKTCVDLDKKLSNISQVIIHISDLDGNKDSPLHELKELIEYGFSIIDYDVALETLKYAERILRNNYKKLDAHKAKKLTKDLEKVMSQVLDGSLTIPPEFLELETNEEVIPKPTKKISGNAYVTGKTLLKKHILGLEGMTLKGKLHVKKTSQFKGDATFQGNVNIAGTLSASNVNISGTLSASDGFIDNLSVVNLTVDNCIKDLCVHNFSASDAAVDNLSAVNLTIDNCLNYLCVDHFTAVDATIDNLSVGNLTVDNCIENLCVNYLSVIDNLFVDSLSVRDEVVTGSLVLPNLTVITRGRVSNKAGQGTQTGVVHNDKSGHLTSGLIVNADVDPSASITDDKLAKIHSSGKVDNSATTATSANTANTIVVRDAVGNFSAGTITANLTGTATAAISLIGPLSGDVTGTQSATIVSSVGGQSAAAIAAAIKLVNSGTSADIPNTIVSRNVSGNFATNMITLDGTPTNPTDAATKSYVDAVMQTCCGSGSMPGPGPLPPTGTNLNVPNTLVQRDETGSFAAQVISIVDIVISGDIQLNDSTDPTTGNIFKNNNRFIHNSGVNNTFIGVNAGSFSITGSANDALGANALTAITTGTNNIAIGYQAGQTVTTGSGNIYIDADAATASENDSIRIGTSQTSCFISGICTSGVSGDGVVVDSTGKLGITLSSERFKYDIQDMRSESENIMKLRPVTFVYINDETKTKQYGLIAEEVEKIFPAIVVKDKEGLPYTVRYQLLPVMLLNEVQKQQAIIEEMRNDINYLRTEIQKLIENKK